MNPDDIVSAPAPPLLSSQSVVAGHVSRAGAGRSAPAGPPFIGRSRCESQNVAVDSGADAPECQVSFLAGPAKRHGTVERNGNLPRMDTDRGEWSVTSDRLSVTATATAISHG